MQVSKKLVKIAGDRLGYWCQGCESSHHVRVKKSPETPHPCWTWDGDIDAPTFSPSVLCTYKAPGDKSVCHTFIKAGMVQFLGDCTHSFAGKTVPLPDWPYADGEYGGVEPLVK